MVALNANPVLWDVKVRGINLLCASVFCSGYREVCLDEGCSTTAPPRKEAEMGYPLEREMVGDP